MLSDVALTRPLRSTSASADVSPRLLDRARYARLTVDDDLLPERPPCDVSIIVVTHESARDIEKCLKSLFSVKAQHEVIVVDNASVDGTADLVAEKFPGVRLIRKRDRHGFSTNCNIGAVAAAGDVLLFLNPDTAVTPGSVEKLLAALAEDPTAGAVGAELRYPDGTPQPSARRFPEFWCTAVRRTPLRWVLPSSEAERHHLRMDEPIQGDAPAAVDWVLGAALAIPAALYAEIGGFDDGYRLYCEDIDICWRIHASGKRVLYVPGAVIFHDLREATRHQFVTRLTLWHTASMLRFVRLHGLGRRPFPEPQPSRRRPDGTPEEIRDNITGLPLPVASPPRLPAVA